MQLFDGGRFGLTFKFVYVLMKNGYGSHMFRSKPRNKCKVLLRIYRGDFEISSTPFQIASILRYPEEPKFFVQTASPIFQGVG